MRIPALIVAFAALSIASAAVADVGVAIDQVRRLAFSGNAADVVVGNPEVAEVTVVDGRNVFVTGRATGVTDVIVLDGSGRILFNQSISVGAGGGRGPVVSITRGASVSSVSCGGRCQDTGATVTRGAPTAARPAAAAARAPGAGSSASSAAQADATAPEGASSSGSAG